MKWPVMLAVVLDLSIRCVASFAQGPPEADSLSTARSDPHVDKLFSDGGVVRFQMIQGRLRLDAPRHRIGAETIASDHSFESIVVSAERGLPSVHYVSKRPSQTLKLDVLDAVTVRMESSLSKTEERSVLEQSPYGLVYWTIERGGMMDRYQGTTLLHVRYQNPEIFDIHYGGLIERILGGRSLASLSSKTRHWSMTHAMKGTLPHRSSIDECVAMLSAKRQATRRHAQQQLLLWGTPVIAALHESLSSDIDAEQRMRVQQTIRMLRPQVEDTPRSLAMLMVNDPTYWNLVSPQLSTMQIAAVNDHLGSVGLATLDAAQQPSARVAEQ
ncbi:hypothetical protein Q31b_00590 [Novipirellula aureliae]|uniref:Secreted protein n=1 Tax=Novipirellula aureliae TaxID=2527966 RepID=A0A5C6ECJ3_9BACT|nr:hypothetical protein [Novipirellula aureliae]TWU44889.1 hypothetical protein Q31b_00590 [Novipirellula aureliae]